MLSRAALTTRRCSFPRRVAAFSHAAGFPAPRLFTFDHIQSSLTVEDAIPAVEEAFGSLAQGNVDVPSPMHIGIEESPEAGPGDCHIKGMFGFMFKFLFFMFRIRGANLLVYSPKIPQYSLLSYMM